MARRSGRPLNANEKDFLAFCARNADSAARCERYRELELAKPDASRVSVQGQINQLLVLPASIVLMEQQGREEGINRDAAMKARDSAAWDREAAQLRLDKALFDVITAKAEDQAAKIKKNDDAADNSTAIGNLAKAGAAMVSQATSRKPMTPEERRQKAKEAGLHLEGDGEQQWPPEHVKEVKAS